MNRSAHRLEKQFKLCLLFGRPMAIGGLIFFVVGSLKHSELDFGKGMLLLTVGFLIAWVGKIGLFWVR